MAAKESKWNAAYTNGPVKARPCKDCTMFRSPDRCTKVEGDINPTGHCRFWYPKGEKDGKR